MMSINREKIGTNKRIREFSAGVRKTAAYPPVITAVINGHDTISDALAVEFPEVLDDFLTVWLNEMPRMKLRM